jgi:hypothetical protein
MFHQNLSQLTREHFAMSPRCYGTFDRQGRCLTWRHLAPSRHLSAFKRAIKVRCKKWITVLTPLVRFLKMRSHWRVLVSKSIEFCLLVQKLFGDTHYTRRHVEVTRLNWASKIVVIEVFLGTKMRDLFSVRLVRDILHCLHIACDCGLGRMRKEAVAVYFNMGLLPQHIYLHCLGNPRKFWVRITNLCSWNRTWNFVNMVEAWYGAFCNLDILRYK